VTRPQFHRTPAIEPHELRRPRCDQQRHVYEWMEYRWGNIEFCHAWDCPACWAGVPIEAEKIEIYVGRN
jgi:hypothetical protein